MKRALYAGGFTAIVVVALVVFARRHPARADDVPATHADRQQPEREPERPRALEAEVTQLRGELGALRLAVAATAAEGSAAHKPKTAAEIAAEDERKMAEVQDALASRMARESKDGAWSEKMEGDITRLFDRKPLPGATLRSVTCKTSGCQVDVEHADTTSQRGLAFAMGMEEPFLSAGAVYYRYADVPQPSTTVYLIRQGATIPKPTTVSN